MKERKQSMVWYAETVLVYLFVIFSIVCVAIGKTAYQDAGLNILAAITMYKGFDSFNYSKKIRKAGGEK